MKLKSVSGSLCYVHDLQKTIDFYEALGFQFKKKASDGATGYVNWYWIEFRVMNDEQKPTFQKEAKSENKGAGIFTYLSVDDVDDAYAELVAKGLKPSSEPKDWPWGNREFVIRDPDGYKLVIFKRK